LLFFGLFFCWALPPENISADALACTFKLFHQIIFIDEVYFVIFSAARIEPCFHTLQSSLILITLQNVAMLV